MPGGKVLHQVSIVNGKDKESGMLTAAQQGIAMPSVSGCMMQWQYSGMPGPQSVQTLIQSACLGVPA